MDIDYEDDFTYELEEEFYKKNELMKEKAKTSILSRIPDLTIESMGGIIPYQMTGKIGDYYFYLRSRNSMISLSLSKTNPDVNSTDCEWFSSMQTSDEDYHCIDHSEVEYYFIKLLENLEKAKFRYVFSGNYIKAVEDEKDGSVIFETQPIINEYYGYGNSPEEALQELKSRFSNLEGALEAMKLDEVPLNYDDRIFDTDEPPIFTIYE